MEVTWGRRANASALDGITALSIMLFTPIWLYTDWIVLHHFGGSLSSAFSTARDTGLLRFASTYSPRFSASVLGAYIAWVVFQALLFQIAPGQRCVGQRTPGGKLLEYHCNGTSALAITWLLFLGAVAAGILDPSLVARHWEGLIVAADLYGVSLSAAAVLKGYYAPTFLEDRKQSGKGSRLRGTLDGADIIQAPWLSISSRVYE